MLLSRKTSHIARLASVRNTATFMSTFANQSSLQHLPVPPLEQTLDRYLKSIIPVTTPEQLAKTKEYVREFAASEESKTLQTALEQRAKEYDNWLEPWWDEYGYFGARIPLPITTNPGMVLDDPPHLPSLQRSHSGRRLQVWRAAHSLHSAALFMREIESDTLAADPNMCMSQYTRLFSIARVPQVGCDRVISYRSPVKSNPTTHFMVEVDERNPTHAVVLAGGHFFTVEVLDSTGNVRSCEEIEAQIWRVGQLADERGPAGDTAVGVLTSMDRDSWATAREKLLQASSMNQKSLEAIQQALFVVVLDPSTPSTPTELGRSALMGDPALRFFDKHMLIVFENGTAALNFEHGPTDGLTLVTMANYIHSAQWFKTVAADLTPAPEIPASMRSLVKPLSFAFGENISHAITAARHQAELAIQAVDIKVAHFQDFGREHIKTLKCSPDGFFQMAVQLAYYRLYGVCVPTYESAATRQFLHGRTETLRSCTAESADFVKSMDQPAIKEPRKEHLQRDLLQRAIQAHSVNIREATNGHGVDRHLMGLSILASQAGLSVPLFADPVFTYSKSWLLSTSSMPTNCVVAFGAVMPEGYGVYYCFPRNAAQIRYTITSYHGADRPANVFANAIADALRDMSRLLGTHASL